MLSQTLNLEFCPVEQEKYQDKLVCFSAFWVKNNNKNLKPENTLSSGVSPVNDDVISIQFNFTADTADPKRTKEIIWLLQPSAAQRESLLPLFMAVEQQDP